MTDGGNGLQCSVVQGSAVKYNALQCNTQQCSETQCSAKLCSSIRDSAGIFSHGPTDELTLKLGLLPQNIYILRKIGIFLCTAILG